MRKFNITTICVPKLHYMIDLTKKYNKIIDMIKMDHTLQQNICCLGIEYCCK